jgi:hypothetical protein
MYCSNEIVLLEQSSRMTDFLGRSFQNAPAIQLISCDAITYLTEAQEKFDFVYSLWSISHAIHQSIAELGVEAGERKSEIALNNLFHNLMRSGAHFYITHFDSTSPEQIIALRQRRKLTPWLVPGVDSPSKLLIEKVLQNLSIAGAISFSAQHLQGEPIVYENLEEALEIFMNFHMESAFNGKAQAPEVIAELERDLTEYQDRTGKLRIPTGCIVYQGTRV